MCIRGAVLPLTPHKTLAMTILPHDRHLSIWQRSLGRLQALVGAFRVWRTDDNLRLPDWWKPNRVERGGRGSDG
jgi:hypothetical protein